MPVEMPVPELSRAIRHEREQEWPDALEIKATFGKKTKALIITKDQFFGTGNYGAPISGDWLISAIDRLRRGII